MFGFFELPPLASCLAPHDTGPLNDQQLVFAMAFLALLYNYFFHEIHEFVLFLNELFVGELNFGEKNLARGIDSDMIAYDCESGEEEGVEVGLVLLDEQSVLFLMVFEQPLFLYFDHSILNVPSSFIFIFWFSFFSLLIIFWLIL